MARCRTEGCKRRARGDVSAQGLCFACWSAELRGFHRGQRELMEKFRELFKLAEKDHEHYKNDITNL